MTEEVLTGGSMTAVVRVGDTVRRTAGPWTPTVHALLRHLRANGFECVPEPLGLDDRGREILSLLPGTAPTYPLPAFAWTDATLRAVARTLRAYHDAGTGFEPPPDAVWQWPAHRPAEVICHNDFAPYNLMFEDGLLTGVIDLDLASPGPRIWDVAEAAYRFVPLTAPANPDAPFPGVREQARRLGAFCSAYGDPRITPPDVVDTAIDKLTELVAFIEREAAAGDPAQQAVLARGDVDIYRRDIEYLQRSLNCMDLELEAYLAELTNRLAARLGDRLRAAWVIGSTALGDFDRARSDIDVQAVTDTRLARAELEELAAALSHEALPCPVRGLEFVLYARADLLDPDGPAFQLNLNTGPGMTQHEGFDPAVEPRFWFTLDVAIARQRSRTLAGARTAEVLPALPRGLVVRSLREALDWYRAEDPAQAILAACRAWAWAKDGRWLSKSEAANWATARLPDAAAVRSALQRRQDPAASGPSPSEAAAIVRSVGSILATQAG